MESSISEWSMLGPRKLFRIRCMFRHWRVPYWRFYCSYMYIITFVLTHEQGVDAVLTSPYSLPSLLAVGSLPLRPVVENQSLFVLGAQKQPVGFVTQHLHSTTTPQLHHTTPAQHNNVTVSSCNTCTAQRPGLATQSLHITTAKQPRQPPSAHLNNSLLT